MLIRIFLTKYSKIGAYGLNREVGINPTRSRRCIGEQNCMMSLKWKVLGRRRNVTILSQKNCLS